MRVKLEMAGVAGCEATECAYNGGCSCHARAITVGDTTHPDCDTFLASERHGGDADAGGVGACKVEACTHNRALECEAREIRVGHRNGRVECLTFEARA